MKLSPPQSTDYLAKLARCPQYCTCVVAAQVCKYVHTDWACVNVIVACMSTLLVYAYANKIKFHKTTGKPLRFLQAKLGASINSLLKCWRGIMYIFIYTYMHADFDILTMHILYIFSLFIDNFIYSFVFVGWYPNRSPPDRGPFHRPFNRPMSFGPSDCRRFWFHPRHNRMLIHHSY